jgi:hypothetical protein
VVRGRVGLFSVLAFELLHLFPNPVEMVFIRQKELGVVALNDGLDFVLQSVNVVDEFMVVFGDLLFLGEFFCLGEEGVFAFFGGVGANGSFGVETGWGDDEFFRGFAFVHGGSGYVLLSFLIAELYLIININVE